MLISFSGVTPPIIDHKDRFRDSRLSAEEMNEKSSPFLERKGLWF